MMDRLKIIVATILVSLSLVPGVAQASVYVHGYYRSNGTYVSPHYRSNPDGNPYNNWSYPGNTNPYTGKTATGNPHTYLENYYSSSSGYSYPSLYSGYTYSNTGLNSFGNLGSNRHLNISLAPLGSVVGSSSTNVTEEVDIRISNEQAELFDKLDNCTDVPPAWQDTCNKYKTKSPAPHITWVGTKDNDKEILSEWYNNKYCPLNATYNRSSKTCFCDTGYIVDVTGHQCMVPVVPAPAVDPQDTSTYQPPQFVEDTGKYTYVINSSGKNVFTQRMNPNKMIGRLYRSDSNPGVYVMDGSMCLKLITNEGAATRMYGENWQNYVNWITDKIFRAYNTCGEIYW